MPKLNHWGPNVSGKFNCTVLKLVDVIILTSTFAVELLSIDEVPIHGIFGATDGNELWCIHTYPSLVFYAPPIFS